MTSIPRTLGRWDLILLKIVAIVNINNVPAVAVYGWTSLVLWTVAFATFFVPEAIAVMTLSRRYPGEGGIYLWIRQEFGEAHGFLSGWCYWTNNLFYVPVLLVYMAGIFAFAGGEARAAALVNQKLFVGAMAFGWLAFITLANVRGLASGKWIQNVGGLSAFASVALVLGAAGAVWLVGVGTPAPAMTNVTWEMTTSFAVMCNALVGIELASTMGDEIRDPARDLGPAIAIAGVVSIGSYLLVTAAVLTLVPVEGLGVIQGVMQAVAAGAHAAGIAWIVAPLAIVMGLGTGGAASAWFAGSSRVPFVAGLTSALPPALGRVHPQWRSPHVALITCAVLTATFTAFSLVGSSVGGSVSSAVEGSGRDSTRAIRLSLPGARENACRRSARARGWMGRPGYDRGQSGGRVSADRRCHQRPRLRIKADRCRGRPHRARMVPVPAERDSSAVARRGVTERRRKASAERER